MCSDASIWLESLSDVNIGSVEKLKEVFFGIWYEKKYIRFLLNSLTYIKRKES